MVESDKKTKRIEEVKQLLSEFVQEYLASFRNQFTNLNKKSLPVKVKLAGDSGNKLPLKRSSNSLTHSITKPGVLRQ